jgi:tetratricopeptide (TPR) repeat protein/tRNA A-37 threonylcarbamoyl transferase component Bud32
LSSLEYLQNGRYVVLKKLGEGGKGVVFKARDTALNRVVAIKVLKNAVASEEAYSRFMTEAQAVAKLNHPNIVSIYDIGKENEKQFFVLEFVDGENLRDLMGTYPEGKCDIQTVLRVGMDVCGALQYAHAQKVLHRDIKPENVMITREGTAKLMDFGLAKMIGQPRVTQEGVIVGTVAYVAPEVALGKDVDARSDLYSFGAVLYEALSGKSPFPGDVPIKVIFGHIHDCPVPLGKVNSKVPQALADCVMKLLEKEPEKRYQLAEDLFKALREISEEFLRETLVPSHKPSIVVPSPRPIAAREIQLIDRVEEMNLLREAVDRAVRGEGGLVFLHGEAGIGKTRLTRELRAYARLRGMQVLYGRCPALFRMDGVPPYVLWNEVIRDYLEVCSPEQLYRVVGFYPAEVAKLVPELRQRLGAMPQSFPISPEMEQNRLFEAVTQFVTNISKESPLLVVLDDLQWTDSTSLLLLHYLARGVYRSPLLLLGAYRSTDIDAKHPLSPVLTELNRERLLQSVSLKRMSLNEISEMIKQILEQDDIPTEFCRLVYEKTRGNPFFAEEVIKSLKEEEIICREENKWKINEVSRIEFPETVKSVVKARVSRLDDECQNVLTLASFVGNDFSCEALCGVTGIEENKLLEIVEELLKTGLVKHRVLRGEAVCFFADIIVRDVVYEEVSPFRRKKLHNVVGCALEKVYAKKIDEHLGELALHFLESGDKDKALGYFLKAGDRAAKIYANSEAASYFQSALNILEEKEGGLQEKGRVLEWLGDIKKLVGEYEACMKYWNEALLLWTKLQERGKTATLHRKMANVLWDKMGNAEKAKEHHEACLKIMEAEPESVENARLYHDMAYMYWRNGDFVKALASAEKAFVLAEKLNALEVVADACLDLGIVLMFSGDYKKGREYANRALKTALDNDYLEIAVLAYSRVASFLPFEEYEKRFEYYEKGLLLAKKVGDISRQSWFFGDMAYGYALMGELDKAITLGEEALALDKKAGSIAYIPGDLFVLGFAYLILGEWSKSEHYYDEAAAISRKLTDFLPSAWSHFHHGLLLFDKAEYAKARESFEEAYKMVERAGDRDVPVFSSQFLIWAYIELGEIEKAQNLLESLHAYALKTEEKYLNANEMSLKAMLFRAQKKYAESVELFEKTLKEWKSINANIWNAYYFARWVLCEYARVYLERDQEGDREKAHNLLNQALEMFQKMGAKKDIEKILAKKKLLTA